MAANRNEASAARIASRDDIWVGHLQNVIEQQYGLPITAITAAPRGYYAETWKITTDIQDYFVKLDCTPHQQRLRASLPVIDQLWKSGIRFINHPIPTIDGHLCTDFAGGTLAVFNWIPGHNLETNDTKPAEYDMLAQVYAVPLADVAIPRMQFNHDAADRFFTIWANLEPDSPADQVLTSHRETLELRAHRLEQLASICRGDDSGFVVTHGDAGGNFMTDGDRCYIVDWDELQLAPPERDAWVMCTKGWARKIFDDALHIHKVNYTLRTERIAYFCYHMLFFYLGEVLSGYNITDLAVEIQDLLEGWAKERMDWADSLDISTTNSAMQEWSA